MDVDGAGSTHGVRMGDFPTRTEPLEVPVAEATPLMVPMGTVTFLLTDIEAPHEVVGAGAGDDRRGGGPPLRRDRRAASPFMVGCVHVEPGKGDSVAAVFTRASDAVAAAIDVQGGAGTRVARLKRAHRRAHR